MKNKYYVVLINPKRLDFAVGYVETSSLIKGMPEVDSLKGGILTNLEIKDKWENWLVLSWQRFEEEDNGES